MEYDDLYEIEHEEQLDSDPADPRHLHEQARVTGVDVPDAIEERLANSDDDDDDFELD